MIKAIICTLSVIACLSTPVFAQDQKEAGVDLRTLSISPWLVDDQMLRCVVVKKLEENDDQSPPSYVLTIISEKGNAIYQEDYLGETIISVFQYEIYGRNLVVLSTSGKFYKTDIFAMNNSSVEKVLSVTSDNFPEIKMSRDETKYVVGISESTYAKKRQVVEYKECNWDGKTSRFVCKKVGRGKP